MGAKSRCVFADNLDLTSHTASGKKIEIAMKKIISGLRIIPTTMVANPRSSESYYKYQDIEKFSQPSKKSNGRDTKPRNHSGNDGKKSV